ncbi:LlaJI family restriction endonuclease [Lachnospiraceae bacterium]|nr:LlaJI family restriction endonuclease [Lachnospiraceae bacterium]
MEIDTLYYYGQDGEAVPRDIETMFQLGTQEMEYSDKLKANVFRIVGFIFRERKMLAVFPKHYYELHEIESLNQTNAEAAADMRLLFHVIKKYSETERTTASARAYMGADDSDTYDADYPFAAFYKIYDYFRRYGLYREKENKVVSGGSGKISWKASISKSQKIISGGNLLFVPLYVNKKNDRQVFITECMAFVIDYTLDYFHSFLSMKKTGLNIARFDYFRNIDYVLAKLHEAKNAVFKDIHKKLVQSLIDFFSQYKERATGGSVHVKIRHYDMVWQRMTARYLNRHFVGMNPVSHAALFDLSLESSPVRFSAKTYKADTSHNRFAISLDHTAFVNHVLYVFDSKYYKALDKLNYKQFAYGEILRYYYPDMTEMHNILFLPGRERAEVHFSLAPDYVGERSMGTKIIEQYLEPKTVMKDYLTGQAAWTYA